MVEQVEAKLLRTENKLGRLRMWVIILAAVVTFAAFAAPLGVIYAQNQTTQDSTLRVICSNTRANIDQLTALATLERRLGVPIDFTIPEVPPQCAGS